MSTDPLSDPPRLDQMATEWSVLRLAHQFESVGSVQARQELLLRYRGAIRSYVIALLQNHPDAEDLAQEIFIRFMRGDFASADSGRGRFRDFLKVAIKNMVRNHWERQQRRMAVSFTVRPETEPGTLGPIEEDLWSQEWRRQLIESTWSALEHFERSTPGCAYYTALRIRSEFSDADSAQLADRMSVATGKSWRADAFRQQLRRARLKFAQLLIEELLRGLSPSTPAAIEEELIALGLMEYVRPFLPEDWRERGELRDGGS